MGFGFVFAIWFIVSFGLAAIAYAFMGLIKPGFAKTPLIAIPLVVGAAPLLLGAVALLWENLEPASAQYKAVFGHAPDRTVTDLRGHADGLTDSEEVYLAFRASPEVLARDIAHFEPLAALPDDAGSGPGWWRPSACRERDLYGALPSYAAEDHRGSTRWEEITLVRCGDGMVYVHARWID